VAEPPVCNTSPLIFLSRIDRLPLLRVLGDKVLVPRAVLEEIGSRGAEDPTVRAVRAESWLRAEPTPVISAELESLDLGLGETAALAIAMSRRGAMVVIDDLLGRQAAEHFGIPVIGTMGVVVRAKRIGRIPSAREVLDDLVRGGMYLSRRILDQALAEIGE
jgi:predicted nucleic acid-binding protein